MASARALASRANHRPTRDLLRLRLLATLLVIDIGVVSGATLLAGWTVRGGPIEETTLIAGRVALALYLTIAVISGGFDTSSGSSRGYGAKPAVRAWTYAMIGLLLIAFGLKVSNQFSRTALIVTYLYGVIGIGSAAAARWPTTTIRHAHHRAHTAAARPHA